MTRPQKIFQGCAVASTYYYVCNSHVYYAYDFEISKRMICAKICSQVWYQGPKGGVKLIKQVHDDESVFPYITKNEELMKQFTWIKLVAEPFNGKEIIKIQWQKKKV